MKKKREKKINEENWMFACQLGDIATIEQYLNNGWDINHRDKDGVDALNMAIFSNQSKMVKYLIEKGANIEAQTHNNSSFFTTPLSIASSYGYTDIMRALIEAGAIIQKDLSGRHNWEEIMKTEAGQAAYYFKNGAVELLIDAGVRFEVEQINILLAASPILNPNKSVNIQMREFILEYQGAHEQRKMLDKSLPIKTEEVELAVDNKDIKNNIEQERNRAAKAKKTKSGIKI